MRRAFVPLCIFVTLALAPGALLAASGLREIMHGWRSDARTVRDMLVGQATYDPAEIQRVLEGYATDAGQIGARVNGRSADARDFKRRFETFQADARSAMNDAPVQSKIRADMSHLMSECRSCHDAFNN